MENDMALRNTYQEYGLVSKVLHLILAILIIGMLAIGFFLSDIGSGTVYNIHKCVGLGILVLAVCMIIWELFNERPAYPVTVPKWEQFTAKAVQFSLIALMLFMPISGWVFSTVASKYPHIFGLSLPMPGIPKSHALGHFFKEGHKLVAWVLLGFVSIHVLAAMKHWLWDKDGVMQRMLCFKS